MRGGKLRHLVTLQENTTTNTGVRPTETWTDGDDVYANVEPIGGTEFFRAAQTQPELSHLVTIRYIAGLTPKWRIKWGTRYFNIISIVNREERNIELACLCKEAI